MIYPTGPRLAVRREECDEIGLKFSPDLYLSNSLIHCCLNGAQKLSTTGGWHSIPNRGLWSPTGPSPGSKKQILGVLVVVVKAVLTNLRALSQSNLAKHHNRN
ncbi:hypothetical protein AVEN_171259-1 [Araneus ventricosus]|uniref:Uncharacterized protein n=1 Tax=Araneus ventricosus TaxID=182803 RepID=A0A4Y2WQ56_ARAVE|nr:hypothetical protein AVEN_171259-1 [Araneus ventricosus]